MPLPQTSPFSIEKMFGHRIGWYIIFLNYYEGHNCFYKTHVFLKIEVWLICSFLGILQMLLNCGVGEDSSESFGLQRDPTSPF